MIPRQAASLATNLAQAFKVLAIVGPRQSGKTTLVCVARGPTCASPYRHPAHFLYANG